jgi:choice-of-anchor A domain-containing protein
MTLIEVVVVVVLLGLVVTVVAAAISVVFRSEGSIQTVIADSHDRQQATNYFPLDVESGPELVAEYRVAGSTGTRGSGCSDTPVDANVLEFETGSRRIAYLVDTSLGTVDRFECGFDGTGWTEQSRVSIVDSLAAVADPVTVTVVPSPSDPAVVDHLELHVRHESGAATFIASPRIEAPGGWGQCPDGNPVAAAHDFGSYVKTSVDIRGGSIAGPLVTQRLKWSADTSIAQAKAHDGIGLYAEVVEWNPATSTKLAVSKGDVVLGAPAVETSKKVYETAATTGQYVEMNGGAKFTELASYGTHFDLDADFTILQQCSAMLAQLLGLCLGTCVVKPGLDDPDTPGSDDFQAGVSTKVTVTLDNTPLPNVLNVPESYVSSTVIQEWEHGGSALSQSRPLIVNILDEDGDGIINIDMQSTSWQNLGNQKNVLVNFPNATEVNVLSPFNGLMLAPFATVTTSHEFSGSIVALTWVHINGTVQTDKDVFDGHVDFP